MLRNTFCAQQVDAGMRLIWITPCKRSEAQLGVETRHATSLQPRSGLNCCGGKSKNTAGNLRCKSKQKFAYCPKNSQLVSIPLPQQLSLFIEIVLFRQLYEIFHYLCYH
jgi:hypothetical protein